MNGNSLPGRRDDVHARAAHRHHRGARRHHQQAGVALPVARAVLQRHAGHRRRPAVRRPQRRAADRARFGHRQAAVGVPDRRRHARARRARSSTRASSTCSRISAGSALLGSARGDSVWLFGLDGTMPPAEPGRPVSRQTAAPPPPARYGGRAASRAAGSESLEHDCRPGTVQAGVRRVPWRGRQERPRRRRVARRTSGSGGHHSHRDRGPGRRCRRLAARSRRNRFATSAPTWSRSWPPPPEALGGT